MKMSEDEKFLFGLKFTEKTKLLIIKIKVWKYFDFLCHIIL